MMRTAKMAKRTISQDYWTTFKFKLGGFCLACSRAIISRIKALIVKCLIHWNPIGLGYSTTGGRGGAAGISTSDLYPAFFMLGDFSDFLDDLTQVGILAEDNCDVVLVLSCQSHRIQGETYIDSLLMRRVYRLLGTIRHNDFLGMVS